MAEEGGGRHSGPAERRAEAHKKAPSQTGCNRERKAESRGGAERCRAEPSGEERSRGEQSRAEERSGAERSGGQREAKERLLRRPACTAQVVPGERAWSGSSCSWSWLIPRKKRSTVVAVLGICTRRAPVATVPGLMASLKVRTTGSPSGAKPTVVSPRTGWYSITVGARRSCGDQRATKTADHRVPQRPEGVENADGACSAYGPAVACDVRAGTPTTLPSGAPASPPS